MAERAYGDAAATEVERNAATLARWIVGQRPTDVRHLQGEVRLPGLRKGDQICAAADALVEANWLCRTPKHPLLTSERIGLGGYQRFGRFLFVRGPIRLRSEAERFRAVEIAQNEGVLGSYGYVGPRPVRNSDSGGRSPTGSVPSYLETEDEPLGRSLRGTVARL